MWSTTMVHLTERLSKNPRRWSLKKIIPNKKQVLRHNLLSSIQLKISRYIIQPSSISFQSNSSMGTKLFQYSLVWLLILDWEFFSVLHLKFQRPLNTVNIFIFYMVFYCYQFCLQWVKKSFWAVWLCLLYGNIAYMGCVFAFAVWLQVSND